MPRLGVVLALAAALAGGGCADATAVYVVVDAQDLARARGRSLTLRAFGPDGESMAEIEPFDLEESPLPLLIRLTPIGGDASRRFLLSARVEREDGTPINENRVVGSFVAGQARYALLCLDDSCIDTPRLGPAGCDPADPGAACEGCIEAVAGVIEAELHESGDALRCPPRPPPPEALCGDGVDDDGDGLIDCVDADCEGRACSATGLQCIRGDCTCEAAEAETRCDDGIDDDCDGAVDCADPECAGLACDDGLSCTSGETCDASGCGGGASACDDEIPCTVDVCDETGGCTNVPDDARCDDGDACTDDVCVEGSGCSATPNAAPCDDGNRCTNNDVCASGSCAGTPVVCDDGNVCTTDACNPATGVCGATNNAAACDDAMSCTVNDVCSGGACAGTPSCGHLTTECATGGCLFGACHAYPREDGTVCRAGDGPEFRCCSGACVSMAQRANCGGCGQDCPSGSCLPVPGAAVPGWHCNCQGGSACPNNQRCNRPPNESFERCVCQGDGQCSTGTCRIREGFYNFCNY